MDDQLKRETRSLEQGAPIEARVREDLEKEGPADGERDVDAHTSAPGSLGSDPVEARRELSRQLRGSAFPADRTALLAEAESQHAPGPVLAALASLPDGQTYDTVHEVWAALEGLPPDAARTDPLTEADG